MTTLEEQRREYNEQKELESLRRVFDTLDKDKNDKIDFKELNEMLLKLDYKAKKQEVEDMIWEVDEDCDKCVSWDEFKLMFQRCRTDRVGAAAEPTLRRAAAPPNAARRLAADGAGTAEAVQRGRVHDARQGLVWHD